ncbi:alpha-2 adrenergic receptor [Elysia marginata]|uniref:Alpha-2 adrenergic receptor n=1 Tax=Elysia marginata TaxID=1093978 RepID=A0AAV4JML0_9GAST|nr:alpha-2 adrenergic receptor [Elysia marginata]
MRRVLPEELRGEEEVGEEYQKLVHGYKGILCVGIEMTTVSEHNTTPLTPLNSTLSQNNEHFVLEDIAWTNFRKLLPIILLFALLAILGTIGNSLSVYIFLVRMRRSFLNDLFILLSGTSLLACAVCLPGEIFDLYHAYIYPSLTLCKVGR